MENHYKEKPIKSLLGSRNMLDYVGGFATEICEICGRVVPKSGKELPHSDCTKRVFLNGWRLIGAKYK